MWAIALGVIAAYAFFVALGAFAPADVPWLSVAVAILVGLWTLHAWTGSRRTRATRDLRLVHSRGRRIL